MYVKYNYNHDTHYIISVKLKIMFFYICKFKIFNLIFIIIYFIIQINLKKYILYS